MGFPSHAKLIEFIVQIVNGCQNFSAEMRNQSHKLNITLLAVVKLTVIAEYEECTSM